MIPKAIHCAACLRLAGFAANAIFALSMNVVQHYGLPDPPKSWTDQNGVDIAASEIALKKFFGNWVYLTAHTLALVGAMAVLSLASEIYTAFKRKPEPRWVRFSYGATVVWCGLSATVFLLYVTAYVCTLINVEWRAQWTMYEASTGYPYERVMHLLHSPLLISPMIDVALKMDRQVLYAYVPTVAQSTLCVAAYVAWYALLTALNFSYTGTYSYPWMYDLDNAGVPHAIFYVLASCPFLLVVLGARRLLVASFRKVSRY